MKEKEFHGNELINLSDMDVEKTYNRFYSTWKLASETKQKSTFQFSLNFNDAGVSELIKFYDNPLEAEKLNTKRLRLVRPKQQTKAERQTGEYQLEQIFDIFDGNTAPNAHIVVLIDKEFNGLIYCYDGQHQTFSFSDTILNNKKFKSDDLGNVIIRRESEGFDFEYSKVWTTLKEFSANLTQSEFDINDIIEYYPKFQTYVSDANKTKLTGKVHFTTSNGASTLMKKLNEHISSHSVTQRVKTDLDGTTLNSLMFDTEYSLVNSTGLLSNLIPEIALFNRTHIDLSKYLPKTFSYDLNSKDYTQMNYDQYLIYIYTMIIAKIQPHTNDGVVTYHLNPKRNSKDSVARKYGSAKYWHNEMWKTYGLVDNVKDLYLNLFNGLYIDDEKTTTQYIQHIISLANHMTNVEFIKRLSLFDEKRKMWYQSYKDERDSLLKTHNVIDKSQLSGYEFKQNEEIEYNMNCVRDLRFSSPYQLVNLSHVILDTLPSSQSVGDWANAVMDVINNNFDKYFKNNADRFVNQQNQTKTSLTRYNVFNELFTTKSFVAEVNEQSSATDTSLWSRTESMMYVTDKLKHTDTKLYLCPHSGEWVDVSNYESHHLSFRSKNPQKEFNFWFPLSKKYNNYISDSYDKNLVAENGTFMDACDYMVALCNAQIKKYEEGGDFEKVMDYEDSITTFNKWKKRANYELLG
jgi:hypothetical protein